MKTAKYNIRIKLYAYNAQHAPGQRQNRPQDAIFDSDSFLIQVDNGASRSISNDRSHFESIEPLDKDDPTIVLGPTGEESPIKGKGTIKWKIEDDDGVVHTIKLKNSLYVPNFTNCLLCTQHWSQVTNDHFPQREGTWQASYSDTIVMYWDQRRYKRTVKWNARTNTGFFRSAAGAVDYRVYAAAVDTDNEVDVHEHVCYQSHFNNTHLISDDEDDNGTDDSNMPNERSSESHENKPSR